MIWRPHNETEEDLKKEALVMDELVDLFRADSWLKLSPMLYYSDAALFRGDEPFAYVEVKVRKRLYPTMILGVGKATHLWTVAVTNGIPAYFVVHVEQGLYCHKLLRPHRRNYKFKPGGNSRGQRGDIEPVIHIPIKQFRRIGDAVIK